jgi:hypothetical protein
VRDAALHGKKHEQAVKWVCELVGLDATSILQGSTAHLLLATPLVPEKAAAVLAAAGLRFTF